MLDQIIIIEDDEATRYAYERAFLKVGYRVKAFSDYFSAAPALDRADVALLIMDIQLPAGTPHGLAVARMIRSRRPDLPVIFVAGHPEYATHVDEPDALYIKPVDCGTLVAAARARLSE